MAYFQNENINRVYTHTHTHKYKHIARNAATKSVGAEYKHFGINVYKRIEKRG